jgi:hypothetical protein
MIRGPVLPQMREGLWALVAGHLDAIETGLSLVLEDLDCSGGHLGTVEGLARDASGAPVLLMLAIDGDVLLSARVLSASEFLSRVGGSLAHAVPEGNFAPGTLGRVLVIGTEAAAASIEALRRLPLPSVGLCRLEPFRVAGAERFAVSWLTSGPVPAEKATPVSVEFAVPENHRADWRTIEQLCGRLDPAVRIDGDRFLRRITWHGRLLGEVCSADGGLRGCGADGIGHSLLSPRDVREFGDRLVRRYADLAGLAFEGASPACAPAARSREEEVGSGGATRGAPVAMGGETLRSTLSSARVTPEEYSALGGPARLAGGGTEVAGVADDVVRIVAAQEGSWAAPSMRTD